MTRAFLWLGLSAALAGCESVGEKADPLAPTVVGEARLEAAMLEHGDPSRAVAYFEQAAARGDATPSTRRSLARAYSAAGRHRDAKAAYDALAAMGEATPADALARAGAAARLGAWDEAASLLAAAPTDAPARERALLEGLVADKARDWAAADSAYARAAAEGNDAQTLNNWGMSMLARGDLTGAVERFEAAQAADPALFVARNNLAIARAAMGDDRPPAGWSSDAERAVLLNNMGLAALKSGRTAAARRLFAEAVAAHPSHYRLAADRLAALGESAVAVAAR